MPVRSSRAGLLAMRWGWSMEDKLELRSVWPAAYRIAQNCTSEVNNHETFTIVSREGSRYTIGDTFFDLAVEGQHLIKSG